MTPHHVDRVPTPVEHRGLAESVGWTHAFDWDAMPASLAASDSPRLYERHGFAVHPRDDRDVPRGAGLPRALTPLPRQPT